MVLYEASQVRDAIGCGCAALLTFAGLGLVVSHQPPMLFDLAGASLAGTGLPAALFFTHAGEFPMYASICGFLLVVGFLYRKWLLKISIPIISLVIMWQVSDLMKLAFNRQRPGYWSLIHESSASYPSGHVVLATTFYGFWAYLAWCSNLPAPARVAIVALSHGSHRRLLARRGRGLFRDFGPSGGDIAKAGVPIKVALEGSAVVAPGGVERRPA